MDPAEQAQQKRPARRPITSPGRVTTPRRVLASTEAARCGVAPTVEPSEADGLAMAGVAAASLGDGGRGVQATGVLASGGSCVHHVLGEGPGARSSRAAFEFVSADAADVLPLAAAARALSAATGRAVIHRVPGALASRVLRLADAAELDPISGASPAALRDDILVRCGVPAVQREGEGAAVLVAAGAEVPRARRLAGRLTGAGTPCAVVVVRALAPLPGDALRAALEGTEPGHLLVLDESARPGRLGRGVGLALGREPAVLSGDDTGPSWLGAALEESAPQAGDEHRWVAAPGGAWARATLLALAESAPPSGPADGGGELHEAPDALAIRWSSAGRDLAVFADPSAFDVNNVSAGASVLVLAATLGRLVGTVDVDALADRLGGDGALWCLDSRPGTGDVVHALLAVRGEGPATDGLLRVSLDALRPDGVGEELDFRPARERLLQPEPGTSEDLAPWFGFHRAGPAPEDAPAQAVTTLAAAERAHGLALSPSWPAVLRADGSVESLAATLHSALDRVSAEGAAARLPRLIHAIDAASREGAADLSGAVAAAGREVAAKLVGSDSARATFIEEVDRLAGSVDGSVESLQAGTPLSWTVRAILQAREPARAALADRARVLAGRLGEVLLIDRLESEDGRSGAALGASLGATGRFFDPAAMAESLPEPGHEPLDPARRDRLQAALATLETFLTAQPVVHVVAERRPAIDGARVVLHPDPLGAAVGLFEGLAVRAADVARAFRLAAVELDGAREARLGPGLAGLDWQGLREDELALLPDVLALTDGARLRAGGFGALSSLLRSSRPVRVLALDQEDSDEASDLSRHHADLGWLGVAHREAAVLQSSVADPAALAGGLAAVLGAWRPVLLVLRRVDEGAAGGPELAADLAARGRAWPELRYAPDAGASWADRLDLDDNPDVPAAWPGLDVPTVDAQGVQGTLSSTCTFADAVAAEPAYAAHLRALPPNAWADPALVPLTDFVDEFDPARPARRLPWVWTLEPDRTLGRAVVSRALALACRDRARSWKQLQELAGYGDVHAERAALAAREASEAEASERVQALEAAHALALSNVAEDAVGQAMDRLASSLLSLDGALDAAALVTPSAPAPPQAAAPAAEAPPPAAEAPPPVEPEDDVVMEDPYIDGFLCTTCNECTNMNGQMFAYNADKQAEIVDITAGTYEELVKAAEACPSRCIHPGAPRAGDASATDDLVARAAAFA